MAESDSAAVALAAFAMSASTMIALTRAGVLKAAELREMLDHVMLDFERLGLSGQVTKEAHGLLEVIIQSLDQPPGPPAAETNPSPTQTG